MRRIFSKLLYEIEEERSVMLVTVVADRGSAPRGAEIRDEVHGQHRQQQRRKRGDSDNGLFLFAV